MTKQEFLQTQHNLIQTVTQRFAWPGGYPLFAVCKDGGALCPDCVEKEQDTILQVEDGCPHDDQWTLIGVEINWEDSHLTCDHCGTLIQSAYGEDPETEAEDEEPEAEPEPTFPWDLPER